MEAFIYLFPALAVSALCWQLLLSIQSHVGKQGTAVCQV